MIKNPAATLITFLAISLLYPASVGYVLSRTNSNDQPVVEFAAIFNDLLSPYLAALAFGTLMFAALLQTQQLRLQRQELEETRAALKESERVSQKTAEANEKTAEALREQGEVGKYTARVNAYKELLAYLQSRLSEYKTEGIASDNGLSRKELESRINETYRSLFDLLSSYNFTQEPDNEPKNKRS